MKNVFFIRWHNNYEKSTNTYPSLHDAVLFIRGHNVNNNIKNYQQVQKTPTFSKITKNRRCGDAALHLQNLLLVLPSLR